MKTLEFVSLWIKNFKSFHGKAQELYFDDMAIGLHYFAGKNYLQESIGSNGAGKSTTWDALSWCLYGQTVRGLKNPDIKSWQGSKSSHVALTIAVDEKVSVIERKTFPNRLLIDEKEVGQEDVDKLIGMSFELFHQTVLYGQGEDLFLDLTSKGKLDLFSNVLDLERWERLSKDTGDLVQTLRRDEAEIAGERMGVTAQLKQLDESIASATKFGNEWEDLRVSTIEETSAQLKSDKDEFSKADHALANAKLSLDSAGTELKHTENELTKAEDELREANQAVYRDDAERNSIGVDIKRLKGELRELREGTTCPTCKQSIKKGTEGKHTRELEERIEKLQTDYDMPTPKSLTRAVTQAQARLDKLKAERKTYRDKLEDAEAGVAVHLPRVSELRARIEFNTKKLAEWQEQKNPHRLQERDLKKKLVEAEKRADALKEELTKLLARIERTQFWVKGFKDVRLYVIEELMAELELTTNTMLAEVGLADWQIRYSVERETKSGSVTRGISVTILSPENSEPVRWEVWSGGEGQRLRVVGSMALSQVLLNHAGLSINLEILDEPTRHMSREGIRDMCEFLSGRAKQLSRRIFYVDHQSVVSSHFASKLTVVKTKEGSRFVEILEDAAAGPV